MLKRLSSPVVIAACLVLASFVTTAVAQAPARFTVVTGPAATGTLISNDPQSVANAGVISLGASPLGFIVVTTSGNITSLYMLQGANHNTQEVHDAAGQFSATAGTGSSTNIYWSAGNSRYELQNNTGGSLSYRVIRLGV